MSDSPVQWGAATMTWAPQISRETAILRVPAFVQGYAALIVEDSLIDVVSSISRTDGSVLSVRVEAGDKITEPNRVDFEPGEIAITADRLTERFDATELRERIDSLVSEAVLEGDALAERDEKRAREFLNDLAASG